MFTPLLAGTAVGTLEFRTAMESSHSIPGVEVVRAWADNIDIAGKTLTVEGAVELGEEALVTAGGAIADSKFTLDYDKLIIAVGSYAQTFGTPGVKEHAFFLKDVGDARRIRRRILQRFEEASLPNVSDEKIKELLNFSIVGGGPTGIEFAAELNDLITDDLSRTYPSLVNYSNITVYDVAPSILGMFDKNLQAYAQTVFKRQGIRVLTSNHVVEVQSDAIVTKEEGRIPTGAVIWSTGLATNPFLSGPLGKTFKLYPGCTYSPEIAISKTRGSLRVDSRQRVLVAPVDDPQATPSPLEDVFALGDCASLESGALPATAQVANQQAMYLGKALNKAAKQHKRQAKSYGLADIETQKEFKFRSLGLMAYLGGWRAITQTDSGEVTGRMAWLLWRTAYLTKSVSWRNRVLIPTYW